MPKRVVVQPNGKLAVFSTIVDHFVYFNADETEIRSYLKENGCTDAEADTKIGAAREERGWLGEINENGFRWRDAMRLISLSHGETGAQKFLKDMAAADAEDAGS